MHSNLSINSFLKTAGLLLLCVFLIPLLSACQTVSVGTRDFIVSDADLLKRQQKVPEKSYTKLTEKLPSLAFESLGFDMIDGTRLSGIVYRHPNARGTVLLFGNNAFRVAQQGHVLIRALKDYPVNIIQFDYRGYGNSGGEPSASLMKSDAIEVFDQVKTQFTGPINVHGHSFGSFVASWLSTQRQLDGLVLEGAATSAEELLRDMTPWYAKPFVRYEIEDALKEYDNRTFLKKFSNPFLILVGEKDVMTAPSHARQIFMSFDNSRKYMKVIAGADHMSAMHQVEASLAYKEFLTLVLD